MRKHALLDINPARCGGRPTIKGTRITTEYIWQISAGSDSEDHLKALRRVWPYVTLKQFKAAIHFEQTRRQHKRSPTEGSLVVPGSSSILPAS